LWSEDDPAIKIYRRLTKKRYLRGKHTYEYERIYVPIPSRLHDIVRLFSQQAPKNKHNPPRRRSHNDFARLFSFGTKTRNHTSDWSRGTWISCLVYCCSRPISHRSVSCNNRQLTSKGLISTHIMSLLSLVVVSGLRLTTTTIKLPEDLPTVYLAQLLF